MTPDAAELEQALRGVSGTAVHASSVGQRFGGDGAGLLGAEPKGAQDQGCGIGAGLAPCLMPYQTGQSRGRWWTERLDDSVGLRTVVMIRQRKGTRSRDFRTFIHDELGRALHGAGAQDLRTYTFMRYIAAMWSTPGVNHAGPAHRRHHAALVIGADSRQQLDDILKSTEVAAVVDRQERHITAAHAYTVDRTVPGIRMKP